MIARHAQSQVGELLTLFPAVALLGPRQVGKTTLALEIAEAADTQALYLDLERPSDRAKLGAPEQYLAEQEGRLVVLELPPKGRWAIEIKRSSALTLARGYYIGCDDVKATRRLVVHTGDESFAMGDGAEAVMIADAVKALQSA